MGFKKKEGLDETVELGDTEKYVSSDDDEHWYEQEVGEKPEKDLFSGRSGSNKAYDGGKSFTKRHKKDDSRSGGRGRGFKGGNKGDKRGDGDAKRERRERKDKKSKRPAKIFNSDGVGPNYKKSG